MVVLFMQPEVATLFASTILLDRESLHMEGEGKYCPRREVHQTTTFSDAKGQYQCPYGDRYRWVSKPTFTY